MLREKGEKGVGTKEVDLGSASTLGMRTSIWAATMRTCAMLVTLYVSKCVSSGRGCNGVVGK